MIQKELSLNIDGQIFDILAHPIRRRILLWIKEVGYLYYTDFKELGLQTGTLYHHLNKLKPYLQQDEEKRYYLSEEGNSAVAVLSRIDPENQDFGSFRIPKYINSLFRIAENHTILLPSILSIWLLLALITGLELRILLAGPFFITDMDNKIPVILLGIFTWFFCILSPYLILKLLTETLSPPHVYFSRAMLATSLPSLFQIIVWVGHHTFSLTIEQIETLILFAQICTQIWSIAIIALALTSSLDTVLDRSFLLSLFTCYLILLVILLG